MNATLKHARDWATKLIAREKEIEEGVVSREMLDHMRNRESLQQEIRDADRHNEKALAEHQKHVKEKSKAIELHTSLKGYQEKAYEREQAFKESTRLTEIVARGPDLIQHTEGRSPADKLIKDCRDPDLQAKYQKAEADVKAASQASSDSNRRLLATSGRVKKAEEDLLEAFGRVSSCYGKEGGRWKRDTRADGSQFIRSTGTDGLHQSNVEHCNESILGKPNREIIAARNSRESMDGIQEAEDRARQVLEDVRYELIWSAV